MKEVFKFKIESVLDDMCGPAINKSDKIYWAFRTKKARELIDYLRKLHETAVHMERVS